MSDDIVIPKESAELLGALMEASLAESQRTVNQLISNLDREAAQAWATLRLVREGVQALLHDDYMPTPNALLRALWPHPDAVEELTEESLKERGISVHDGQNT